MAIRNSHKAEPAKPFAQILLKDELSIEYGYIVKNGAENSPAVQRLIDMLVF